LSSNGSATLIPYIRQSREREKTISLDEQRRAIESWAEANGMALAEPVVERGVSGSKAWRQRELGRVIESCERGEAAGVVVAYLDRLSREEYLGTAEVWTALQRAGARLVAAAEGGDVKRMEFVIKAELARQQWERYHENWENARRNAVERGLHPSPRLPFGYTHAPENRRKLVPHPMEAPAVRELFRMRAQGASWNELCVYLEGLGLKTRWKGSATWTYRAVSKIIGNRVYLGEARSGDFVNPDAHEPLVSRAVWLEANRPRRGRIVKKGAEGARLSGLVHCAGCGRRMSAELPPTKSRKAGSSYSGRYMCRPRRVAGDPCDAAASASMGELDRLVVKAFVDRYERGVGEIVIEEEVDSPELLAARRDLDRATHALEELTADPVSLADLAPEARKKLLANAQSAVDVAQTGLDAIEQRNGRAIATHFNVARLSELFEPEEAAGVVTPIPDQRRLLGMGIERVVVRRGKEPLPERVSIEWSLDD
jgi:hypothetical protein